MTKADWVLPIRSRQQWAGRSNTHSASSGHGNAPFYCRAVLSHDRRESVAATQRRPRQPRPEERGRGGRFDSAGGVFS
jgi:hypothetical protein